jgi:glycolate oxidase FAD binding subunit
MDEATALDSISRWAGKPLPLSASCHVDGALYLRLSGAGSAVDAAQKKLGGDPVAGGVAFWRSIREQTHAFFAGAAALWRLSIKPTAPPLGLGPQLIEWNGGLRWIAADLNPSQAFETAQRAGGHATLFRGGDKRLGIQQLPANLLAIHKKLKRVFDPEGILSPGRIHADF